MADRIVLGTIEAFVIKSKNNKPVELCLEGVGDYGDPFAFNLNVDKTEKLYKFIKANFIERN